MSYSIQLARDVPKFLKKAPSKHAQQIKRSLLSLLENPFPQDSKQLKGYSFFRVDTGEYRIIYEVESEIVKIILIGKRNDDEVYKKLNRLTKIKI